VSATLDTAVAPPAAPEAGQLAFVRGRMWAVGDVARDTQASLDGRPVQHLVSTAVAIGVGGVLPHLSTHTEWPYRLLGLGYGALAATIFVVGSVRQRHGEAAHRQGDLEPPLGALVMWVAVGAIALTTVTLTLLAIGF
jgi:hypothetical protein